MTVRQLNNPSRRVAISALAALLGLGILCDRAGAAGSDAAEPVRGFYDTLLSTMQNGQSLSQGGRYAKLEPVVLGTFDIPYMTRMAVGASWAALPPAKQQELTQSFGRYITATWADRFDGYSGEKLEVTGELPYSTAVAAPALLRMRPLRPASSSPRRTASAKSGGSTLCEQEAMKSTPPRSTSVAASRASLR